jgi:hypothetical protein
LRGDDLPQLQRFECEYEVVDLFRADNQLERVVCLVAFVIVQDEIEDCIAVQRDDEFRIGWLDAFVVEGLNSVIFREVNQ